MCKCARTFFNKKHFFFLLICICAKNVVILQSEISKNVVSMRKIVSLLTCVLLAAGMFAGEYNVTVSNYYSNSLARTRAYYLVNEAEGIEYVFPIVLPEGATDIEFGKTYTLSDMNKSYAFWWYPNARQLGALYTAATFTATRTGSDITRIEAHVTDTNGDIWHLTYDGSSGPQKPEGGTIQADSVEALYGDNMVKYVLGVGDNLYVFVFTFALSEGQQDLESGVEYMTLDMVSYPYSVGYFNIHSEILYADISFTKTVAEDGSYTITATVLDEDGFTWNISGSRAAPPDPTTQHLKYDTEDADFNHTFHSYDLNLSTLRDGYVILKAEDEENMRAVYLQFWTRSGYEIFGAATYPIDYTQGDYTVNASSGEQDGGMTLSFVSTLAKDEGSGEYIPNQLWLLVTGTVTVREDGVISIEGQNSFGRTIKATLYPEDYVTALEDTQTNDFKAQKVLQNGQILIIQPNRKFSITGSPTY